MILLAQAGNMEAALKIIKEDHGTAVWQTYMNLSATVDPIIQGKKLESQERYNELLNMSITFQFILFLIGVPTLLYSIFNLTQGQKKRTHLFQQLDKQNRSLIFDSQHSN